MQPDTTTGPEIVRSASAAVAWFVAIAALTHYVYEPRWSRSLGALRAMTMVRATYWLCGLLVLIGIVALIVGIIAWFSGTTFRTT